MQPQSDSSVLASANWGRVRARVEVVIRPQARRQPAMEPWFPSLRILPINCPSDSGRPGQAISRNLESSTTVSTDYACTENPLTTCLNINGKHCEVLTVPFDGNLSIAISWIKRNLVRNDNLGIHRDQKDSFRVAIKENGYRIPVQPEPLAVHAVGLYTARAEKSIELQYLPTLLRL